MPNKYGDAALIAAAQQDVKEPKVRWMLATKKVFPNSPTSQLKGCPKGAFLGLCEEGLIKGIPAGHYTTSKDNKRYALRAIELLSMGKSFASSRALWNEVMSDAKKVHNNQMDVVLSLWQRNLIAR